MVDYVLQNQMWFWWILELFGTKIEFRRNFKYRPILAPKVSKEAQWMSLWTSCQSIRFLGNGGTSKILLLQSHEVLWIHWCEPVSTRNSLKLFSKIIKYFQCTSILFTLSLCASFERRDRISSYSLTGWCWIQNWATFIHAPFSHQDRHLFNFKGKRSAKTWAARFSHIWNGRLLFS